MNFKQNEEAVSPVIGVILMVAITVILAAVIAAFVFGMGSDIGTTKTVAVTASQVGSDIVVNYKGGADANTLNFLKVTVNDGTAVESGGVATKYCYEGGSGTGYTITSGTSDLDDKAPVPVGATIVFEGEGNAERNHVVVVGHFMDGSEHVVLDTYV
jgi:flagellin-like protein